LDTQDPESPLPGEAAAAAPPAPAPPFDSPPAPAPPFEKSGLLFFAALLFLFFPGLVAQWLDRTFGLAWSEVFVFLVPSLMAASGSNLDPLRYLGLARPRARELALGALVGGAGFLVANGVMALWARILPRSWLELFDLSQIFDAPLAVQVAIALVASLVAPLCEEVAFRGYLQRTLAIKHGPAVAVPAAALLFGLLHLDPVRFPALVLLGVLFGWLAWRSGSIWPAIAAHATNNGLASALALWAGAPDTQADASTPSDILRALAVGGVALALLLRAFRRATPAPPEPSEGLARRDVRDPSLRFRPWLVPRSLVATAAIGLALLAALGVLRVMSSPA
jgi:hypothetical protein